jgi:hypothetical protein
VAKKDLKFTALALSAAILSIWKSLHLNFLPQLQDPGVKKRQHDAIC